MANKAPISVFHPPAPSAAKIGHVVERVQNGNFNERELINLYDNANKRDVSAIMDVVKIRMRADFPRAATRKFGPKENDRKLPVAEGPKKAPQPA